MKTVKRQKPIGSGSGSGRRSHKSRYSRKTNKTKRAKTTKGNTSNARTKQKVIMVEKSKVESFLLFNILFNYYILLVSHETTNNERMRKQRLEELILQMRENNKFISRDTTPIQVKNIVSYLDTFFHQLLLLINESLKHESLKKNHQARQTNRNNKQGYKHKHKHHGGFYFKSLEEKGAQPITGADLTKLLDEMQQFFYNAKYTEEGKFLQDTDTLISMLRGDVSQFKGILQYRIFPQFYNAFPPFIKWDAIYHELIEKKRWEDLPDYLIAYQSYLRSRDEYLVEKGLKPPSILQRDLYTGFYNKMANSINDNMYAFQQARNKYQGKFFPITLPP